MRRLLWVGDAVVASGFAKSTHYILDVLRQNWDVHVLGVNYRGDPHTLPYPVYPCWAGGDVFGLGRIAELVNKLRPAVVVVQNDPWNFPEYLRRIGSTPTVGIVAVDGKNCRGTSLNGLAAAIFWTEFGAREASEGGYQGPSFVIPLGVDLSIYYPTDKLIARKTVGIPERLHNAFIVGNVNRNQPRKRLDLALMAFAQWIREYEVDDAYFYFHTAPTGDNGYDVAQLAGYLGISNRLILAEPEIGMGVPEAFLAHTYNAFDAMLSTTQGEGFGLTTFEGMACGVPQIVPDWSALGELCRGHALLASCPTVACTTKKINAIGGVASVPDIVSHLQLLYSDLDVRKQYAQLGLELASQDRFRWPLIGQQIHMALDKAVVERAACRNFV